MKVPCNDKYPLGKNSSCTYDWAPCYHGSDHDVLLWFQFSNNMGHLSSTSQRSSSGSTMFHLWELAPWYLDDIVTLHHLLWILPGEILLIDFAKPQVLGCRQLRTLNTFSSPSLFSMSLLFDNILQKHLDIMCRGYHQHFVFSHVSIEFMARNTILSPRWSVLSSTTSVDSRPMQTWSCMSWYAFPWKGLHWYLCIITFSLLFVFLNLSCDIIYLSSDNCLLM